MSTFSRRLPPLGTLVVFEAAFRLGSFSRAADEVALSQASVSRQIRQLEENLGVSLFVRKRHDVTPTDEGKLLAETVRLALRELGSTAERLRSVGIGKKSFTVFSDISIASTLITPVISVFQQQYKDLQLRVLSSYEPIQTVTDEFDVGFQVGRVAEDQFDMDPIADDAIFPVCSPAFASRLPKAPSAVNLAKQPLLHLDDIGNDWPNWQIFLALYRVKHPTPNEGLVFNSYQVCLDVAERGEGIALGWARSVQARINDGKLVRIQGMTMPLPESIFVYRRKFSSPNPIADQFIKTLKMHIDPVCE